MQKLMFPTWTQRTIRDPKAIGERHMVIQQKKYALHFFAPADFISRS
jgi:hypothetical protein